MASPLAGLLRSNKLFRNFLAASTISMVGSHAFDIAMPLYVLQKTHSALALSLVTMCLTLPYFLMAPLTGFSADHLDKRRLLLFSDLGQILCMVFLLYYDYGEGSSLWPVLVAVFVGKSLLLLFETISSFQLIPGLVKPEELSRANTLFLSFHRIVQTVGPLLAGILMGVFGVQGCILANIASFFATLYFTFSLPNLNELLGTKAATIRSVTLFSVARSFSESLKYVWTSKLFRPFMLLMFVWNLSPMTLNSPTLTYYFTVTHHFSPSEYGIAVSAFGVLGVLGFLILSPLYDRNRFGDVFLKSCFLQGLFSTVGFLLVGYPYAFAAMYGLSRIGSSGLSLGSFLIRQTRVPRHQAGAVNACLRMFFMSAAPISSLLQGVLITHFGVVLPMALGAITLWGTYGYAKSLAAWMEKEENPSQDAARKSMAA